MAYISLGKPNDLISKEWDDMVRRLRLPYLNHLERTFAPLFEQEEQE